MASNSICIQITQPIRKKLLPTRTWNPFHRLRLWKIQRICLWTTLWHIQWSPTTQVHIHKTLIQSTSKNPTLSTSPAKIWLHTALQERDKNVYYWYPQPCISTWRHSRDTPKELNVFVHSVIKNIPMSDTKLCQFQNETAKDLALQI